MNDVIHFYYPGNRPVTVNPKSGPDCWIIKTFDKLQEYGMGSDIKLLSEVPEEGIIVFHKGLFPKGLRPSPNQYFVCIQADYGRYRFAQYHIHQNPRGPRNFRFSKRALAEELLFPFVKNTFIPHWNQDAIHPRKPERGILFENIVFMGLAKNFPQSLLRDDFLTCLKEMGLNLRIITNEQDWGDYSEVDCVLAIRDLNGKPHFNKPSSKIVNGFLAGVPVIAGSESSALYLKQKLKVSIDCVTDQESLLNAIKKMRNAYSEALSNTIDSNRKLAAYHDDSISSQWQHLFEDLRYYYHRWKTTTELYRWLFYQFSQI